MCSGIEFVNRIDSVLKDSNKTRKELAKKLNIIPATMATWKTKDIMPPVDTIQRIADELIVSIDWLVTGKEYFCDNYGDANFIYNKGFQDGINYLKNKINNIE